MNLKQMALCLLISVNLQTSFAESSSDQIDYFKRYGVTDLNTKIINNTGDGFEPLYGLRNMRMVLKNILYRGGGNNYYHRTNKRSNTNPLPADGLENLCKEKFNNAIYLYKKNFNTAPQVVRCNDTKVNSLHYHNLVIHEEADIHSLLKMVFRTIQDKKGPIYAHCWNGWHASGLVSALSLRQFCEFPAELAVEYWDINTDGNNKNPAYERIRQKIRDFKPIKDFEISNKQKLSICPNLDFQFN